MFGLGIQELVILVIMVFLITLPFIVAGMTIGVLIWLFVLRPHYKSQQPGRDNKRQSETTSRR